VASGALMKTKKQLVFHYKTQVCCDSGRRTARN
jgi:hypothetical protein